MHHFNFFMGYRLNILHYLIHSGKGSHFFGHNNKGVKRITHVGMYIGDTEVIHCSGMVRINSLDSTRTNYSEYLKDGMMGVRRIIGTESGKRD